MRHLLAISLSAWLVATASAEAQGSLIGKDSFYEVQSQERLEVIAQRFAMTPARLRKLNRLKRQARLEPGQLLFIGDRHIVPEAHGAKFLINIPDLMLYRFQGNLPIASHPVGLGQPFVETASGSSVRWQTPTGDYRVVELRKDPVWTVPKSIQEEMALKGKPVVTRELPGPKNPLGKYWIGLSAWGYGIHGTNAPDSVGRFTTHGCIRMKPGAIDEIFGAVALADAVRISYEPVKVVMDGPEIYMEAHEDVYRKHRDLHQLADQILHAQRLEDQTDRVRLNQVLRDRWGIAVRIDRLPLTRPTPAPRGTSSVP